MNDAVERKNVVIRKIHQKYTIPFLYTRFFSLDKKKIGKGLDVSRFSSYIPEV